MAGGELRSAQPAPCYTPLYQLYQEYTRKQNSRSNYNSSRNVYRNETTGAWRLTVDRGPSCALSRLRQPLHPEHPSPPPRPNLP